MHRSRKWRNSELSASITAIREHYEGFLSLIRRNAHEFYLDEWRNIYEIIPVASTQNATQ